MKIHLSTITLLLAVASAAVSFAVQAEENGSAQHTSPALQTPAKRMAPKPALAASMPSASPASREPLAVCACVRSRSQA
jgi:hypothetical protein